MKYYEWKARSKRLWCSGMLRVRHYYGKNYLYFMAGIV
jgi:hypothetical protein